CLPVTPTALHTPLMHSFRYLQVELVGPTVVHAAPSLPSSPHTPVPASVEPARQKFGGAQPCAERLQVAPAASRAAQVDPLQNAELGQLSPELQGLPTDAVTQLPPSGPLQ